MDFIHLTGTETVQNAASRISNAVENMTRAASQIDETLRRFELFMDNWMARLTELLNTDFENRKTL